MNAYTINKNRWIWKAIFLNLGYISTIVDVSYWRGEKCSYGRKQGMKIDTAATIRDSRPKWGIILAITWEHPPEFFWAPWEYFPIRGVEEEEEEEEKEKKENRITQMEKEREEIQKK